MRSVKLPPASVTMTCSAATSHGLTSASAARSSEPSATRQCCQKSPNARFSQQASVSARYRSLLPCSDQVPRSVVETYASGSSPTRETAICRSPCPSRRQAPAPCDAYQRRPSIGALAMPTTGVPSTSSAINVAHTGRPRRKFLVPSIGSTSQHLPLPGTPPRSSPATASPGRRCATSSRMRSSTARSASVTGVRSGFRSTARSAALNRARVISSAASASSTESASSAV